jgi:hypothetical protein
MLNCPGQPGSGVEEALVQLLVAQVRKRTVPKPFRRFLVTMETQVLAQLLERLTLVPELDLANILDHAVPQVAGRNLDRGDRCGSVVVPFMGPLKAPVLVEEAAQIRETKPSDLKQHPIGRDLCAP